ncbi:MAG: MaoC family dehydratase [Desulfovibrio sp.]|jgi:acyl dehydratase|nr:MaoC family dehydratase [Desulfovibrio sp.]
MSLSSFAVPREARFFEDYVPGAVYEFAESVSLSEEEIVAFAKEYDPQYFHVDPVLAAQSIYKGLIASGGQTICVAFKIYVRNVLPEGRASLGSPGMDEIRWLLPVRPGDALRMRLAVLQAEPSKSRPDRGTVSFFCELLNQNDEVVMTCKCRNIILKRNV